MNHAQMQLRQHVASFMAELPVPEATDGAAVEREDGVVEFGKHWRVRGDEEQGLFASYADRDDVIEFGLLERDGDTAINALHCTLVLEDGDGLFHVASDANTDLNYEVRVRPDATGRLDDALRHFADVLRASA